MIVLRLGKRIEMVLAEHGLTPNQYRALGFIAEGDPNLAEMSDRLVMKRPNLTALLDGLVERGLIEKRRRSDDRRRVELVLSKAGAELFAAASEDAERALAMLASLDGRDPERRLRALSSWGPAVEEAARRYRAIKEASPSGAARRGGGADRG